MTSPEKELRRYLVALLCNVEDLIKVGACGFKKKLANGQVVAFSMTHGQVGKGKKLRRRGRSA